MYGDVRCSGGYTERYTQTYNWSKKDADMIWGNLQGKVVAEFTLNKVETIEKNQVYNASVVRHNGCLNIMQLHDYTKGKRFHAWHIDDLKIYDEPRELSEFYSEKECSFKDWGDVDNKGCWESYCEIWSRGDCKFGHLKLDKPPQSWCYVEEKC